jgi:hypothetical protein
MIILTPTSTAVVLPWPLTSRDDQANPMPGPRFPHPTRGHTAPLASFASEMTV